MKVNTIAKELNSLAYHGRGIIIGKSADGSKAITAYFIMGRSVNSRNRVFVAEGEAMREHLPARAYKIALCVEGKQLSSEQLAARIDEMSARASEICLVIGSSYGIAPSIKQLCDMKLSFSALTFPHQLARVVLYEVLYRCMNILKGTKYHK